jgi:hypothetical protein
MGQFLLCVDQQGTDCSQLTARGCFPLCMMQLSMPAQGCVRLRNFNHPSATSSTAVSQRFVFLRSLYMFFPYSDGPNFLKSTKGSVILLKI